MEVICPKCNTTYDFEDTLIGPKGTVVRCTQCGHMFKIFRGGTEQDIDTAGWMVRKKNGPVYNVDRFSTLQKWILEGKMKFHDELSRTGKSWKTLGEIVELSGLFKLSQIEAASRHGREVDASATKWSQSDMSAASGGLEPRASVTPVQEEAWQQMEGEGGSVSRREPSPDFQNVEEGTVKGPLARTLDGEEAVDEGESIMKPVYQPARGKKIAIVIVVLVLLAPFVYFGVQYRAEMFEWMGMLKEPDTGEAGIDEMLKQAGDMLLADTEQGLKNAEKLYKFVIGKDPGRLEAIVGLSEIYARRAQYFKDTIDFPRMAGGESEDEAAAQSRFMSLVIKARDYAKEAVKINAGSCEAQRVMADAFRLSGDFGNAAKAINKALDARPGDAGSIYVQVLLDYDRDKDINDAIAGLKRALRKDENLTAVRYRLAFFLTLNEETEKARKELDRVLDRHGGHDYSKSLLAALEKGALLAAAADASVEGDVAGDTAGAGEKPSTVVSRVNKGPSGKGYTGDAVPGGKSYDYYYNQANKYENAGNCSKAVDYFNKALDANPSSAECWAGKGHCFRDMGRIGDAVNAYRKALKFNSRFGPAIIGLAEIFKQQSKHKLALEYYKKYLDIFSAGPQAGIAKRNVQELEDLLKTKGGKSDEGEEKPAPPASDEEKGPKPGKGGPTVIKSTEEEVKSSIGQPTSDTPKTDGDPYD